jgi:hypothetical protein
MLLILVLPLVSELQVMPCTESDWKRSRKYWGLGGWKYLARKI